MVLWVKFSLNLSCLTTCLSAILYSALYRYLLTTDEEPSLAFISSVLRREEVVVLDCVFVEKSILDDKYCLTAFFVWGSSFDSLIGDCFLDWSLFFCLNGSRLIVWLVNDLGVDLQLLPGDLWRALAEAFNSWTIMSVFLALSMSILWGDYRSDMLPLSTWFILTIKLIKIILMNYRIHIS
jgi:hypothetical protein